MLCILNGVLDSSAVVFVVMKLMYDAGSDFHAVALGYFCVCVVIVGMSLLVFIPSGVKFREWMVRGESPEVRGENPRVTGENGQVCGEIVHRSPDGIDNLSTVWSENETDSEPVDNRKDDQMYDITEENAVTHRRFSLPPSATNTNVTTKGVLSYIGSRLYIFHLIYLCTISLYHIHFIGSLADRLTQVTNNNEDMASSFIDTFGYISLGGLLVTPLLGILFDRDTFFSSNREAPNIDVERRNILKLKQSIAPITVTILLALLMSVLGLFEDIALQIPQYILFTVVRGFLYASHSSFIAVAFPTQHFATLLGFGFLCSGVFVLLNYGLFELTMRVFGGKFFFTNVVLLVLMFCSFVHPLNVWYQVK